MHGERASEVPAVGEQGSDVTTAIRPLLVSLPQARVALGGITLRELYHRIEAGDIERVKIGKRAFITLVSIESYVERLRRESAERLAALRDGSLKAS